MAPESHRELGGSSVPWAILKVSMRAAKMECCRSEMPPSFSLAVKVNIVIRNETRVSTRDKRRPVNDFSSIFKRWLGEGGVRPNHYKERYYSKHFASSTMPCILAYAFYKAFIFIKHGLVSR